jgi:hypothetical protein
LSSLTVSSGLDSYEKTPGFAATVAGLVTAGMRLLLFIGSN